MGYPMNQPTFQPPEPPSRSFATDAFRSGLGAAPRTISYRLWAGMAAVAVVAAAGVGALAAPATSLLQDTTAAAPVAGAPEPAAGVDAAGQAAPEDDSPGTSSRDGQEQPASPAAAPAVVPEGAVGVPEGAVAVPEGAVAVPEGASAVANAPAPALAPAPAAPAPTVPATPASRTIYVAGAGGQSMVDACIGPVHYTPNDGYSLFITEHDFCGGWARFSGIGVGETVKIPGYGTYTATARGQVPNPGTTNDVIAVFGNFPRAILQTCIPGTRQMLLIALN